MKKILAFSLALFALMFSSLACNLSTATPKPTATPEFGKRLEGAANNQVAVFETQQAEDLLMDRITSRMTATQAVLDGIATREQRDRDAVATKNSSAATQQVLQITLEAAKTQDFLTQQAGDAKSTSAAMAQGTAMQMAVLGITATVEFNRTATAEYNVKQAPIEAAKIRALNAQADSAELARDREAATNWLQAYGPWLFAFCCLAALAFVMIKKSEVGVIQNGRGDVELVKVGRRMTKPSLMILPVLQFDKDEVTAPELGVPMDVQSKQAHESNVVAGIANLPQWAAQQAKSLLSGLTSQAPGVQIQVLQPGQMGSVRDELEQALAEEIVDG
jgi:hypothetical protein